MHRHHALGRQQVVENAEHRFLHLAGIGGATNQDQLLAEIDRDHGLAAATVPLRIGAERRQVDNRVFRLKAFQLRSGRTDKQGSDEQVVPRIFVDDPHVDPVFRLRTTKQVGDVELVLRRDFLEEIRFQRGEVFRRHALVDVTPPHGIFGFGIADDKLVFRGTPGVLAGFDHQRAVLCKASFAVTDCVLDQRRCPEIRVDRGVGFNSLAIQRKIEGGGAQNGFLQCIRPSRNTRI